MQEGGPFRAFLVSFRMTESDLRQMLDEVRAGTLDADAAAARIREAFAAAPFEDLGFARVDTHRHHRQGFPEVILGLGKTPAQIAAIAERIVAHGQSLLVTRASKEAWDAVRAVVPKRPITRTRGRSR